MRLVAFLVSALALAACDVTVKSESENPDPPGTDLPSGTDTAQAITVSRQDTIERTPTTLTLVKRTLRILRTDTAVLSSDTLRVIDGTLALDSGLSVLPPCLSGLTVYNAYGSEVLVELWSGNARYLDGRVYGAGIKRLDRLAIPADSAHNRTCTVLPSAQSLLVVAGVEPGAGGGAILLDQGQFQVDSRSILVVDRQGFLRPLR